MPSIIYQQRKYESIAHLMPQAMVDYAYLHNQQKKAKQDPKAKDFNERAREYDAKSRELKGKYNFNPYTQQFKQIIPVCLQVPVHLSLFVATRTMYPSYPEWKEGGTAWFTDLSLGDPFYVWPTMASLAMIASGWSMFQNMEFAAKFPNLPVNLLLYATTGVSLCFIPVAGMFPVGLNIYLASNIVSFMLQTHLMDDRKFRALVGLKPKSYVQGIQSEISKRTREMKEVMTGGRIKEADTEIRGKRGAKGKVGRKVNLKAVRK